MPEWCNGSHERLKISWPQGRVGSSPTSGTMSEKISKIAFLYCLLPVLLLLTIYFNLNYSAILPRDQFTDLAQSMMHGQLNFLPQFTTIQTSDMAEFSEKYYWPLGVFPALFILPFVTIGQITNLNIPIQEISNFVLSLLIFYLCFSIARKYKFEKLDSIILAMAFCFGSMFLGILFLPVSWYFAQTVTVAFLFAALVEYLNKKRWWIIGILLGCVFLTRITAGLGIVFFILIILTHENETKRSKGIQLLQLLVPFGICIGADAAYNYMRFNSFFEQGYRYQVLLFGALSKAREYGLFSLLHLPGNLYYAFLHEPLPVFKDTVSHVLKFPFIRPDPWGMGIFFTSPYLLYLFFMEYKDTVSIILLSTIGLIALPIFLYYGIGFSQFGYRYALDFMPFVFFLFVRNYALKAQKLTPALRLVIFFSIVFTLYLFFASRTFLISDN